MNVKIIFTLFILLIIAGYTLSKMDSSTTEQLTLQSEIVPIAISGDSNSQVLRDISQNQRELLDRLTLMQKQQKSLVAANSMLSQRIEQLESSNQTVTFNAEEEHEVDFEQLAIQREIEELEAARRFEHNFDEHWANTGYEEVDEAWHQDMEASFADIQSQLSDELENTSSINSVSCGSSKCAVEFAHQLGSTDEQRAEFLDEMLPEGASQVMYKQVNEGGVEKTYAIYMR